MLSPSPYGQGESGDREGFYGNYPLKAQRLVVDALLHTSRSRVLCCCEEFRKQYSHLLVNPKIWDHGKPALTSPQLRALLQGNRLVHGVQLYQHIESPHLLEKHPPPYAIEGGEFIMRIIRDRGRDVVSPCRVIPAARKLHVLGDISFAVLEQACRTVGQAQENMPFDMDISVSVNAPMEMLSDPNCAGRIQQISRDTRIPLRNIVLELLQKESFDPSNPIPLLMLSKLTGEDGVSIAIDDFPMEGAREHIRVLREHAIPVQTIKFSGGNMSTYGAKDGARIKRLLQEAHDELTRQPRQPLRQKTFVLEGFGTDGMPEVGYHPATLSTIREARKEMHDERDDDERIIRWLYEGVHTERVLTVQDVLDGVSSHIPAKHGTNLTAQYASDSIARAS